MVNKCAAHECRSGYKKKDVGEKVTFHSFPPQNKELCDRWLRLNPRQDFVPTKHSTLCSLHFTQNDFVEVQGQKTKDWEDPVILIITRETRDVVLQYLHKIITNSDTGKKKETNQEYSEGQTVTDAETRAVEMKSL